MSNDNPEKLTPKKLTPVMSTPHRHRSSSPAPSYQSSSSASPVAAPNDKVPIAFRKTNAPSKPQPAPKPSRQKSSPVKSSGGAFKTPTKPYGRIRIGSDVLVDKRPPTKRVVNYASPEKASMDNESSNDVSDQAGSEEQDSDKSNSDRISSIGSRAQEPFTPQSTLASHSPTSQRRLRSTLSESGTSLAYFTSNTSDSLLNFTPIYGGSPLTKHIKPPKMTTRIRHTSQARTDAAHPILHAENNKTIYTAGRPPWYNTKGDFTDAFVIGICGGSASGKTTVAKKIIEHLNIPWVVWLSMDCFYKDLNEEELQMAAENKWNFDAPQSFDLDYCVKKVGELKAGKAIDCPQYDFATHKRMKTTKPMYGANVIIFEGILVMCDKRLRDMMDLKIFVDTDSDIRLARRIKRDLSTRGRDLRSIIGQYTKFVKPAYDYYIQPLMQYADIVIPQGGENVVAVNLVIEQVIRQLEHRNKGDRSQLAKSYVGQPLPNTCVVLKDTNQVRGIHTILRDTNTSRDEFIFYSRRLMRKLFEEALALLPHEDEIVETPQGIEYCGTKFAGGGLCGVSILRAGETMEHALFQVTKDIRLGKILIQTNNVTGEPELHFLRLPSNLENEHVILMDATVATGAAAMMAIRVLLDHGVKQKNIILTSLLMAVSGVHSVAYAYPEVKMVTTAVDQHLDDNFHMVPGMGNFGDRYFGTEQEAY